MPGQACGDRGSSEQVVWSGAHGHEHHVCARQHLADVRRLAWWGINHKQSDACVNQVLNGLSGIERHQRWAFGIPALVPP